MSARLGGLIVVAVFAAWSACCVRIGWILRDGRAAEAEARAELAAHAHRAETAEALRETDHDNARHGTEVERQRVEASAQSEVIFREIEKVVIEYVYANPDPAGCELDADGLHAWRAANEGRPVARPESDNRSGAIGALPGGNPAAGERQP